ncbi:fimbria/pilus periplasmic chaperone [Aeromonas hydrophila]|uniref:fimbria/pilus periplasmic chaperone n=1 Tax=Aeromonas hydrophila TaxID=644 RepID=UPI0029DCAB5E|nr:fimbria/pilus periplasmic chaperone [Aeromonas hydrophila]MDX7756126.1 fimbria/pilus periplasmic chaperone [Aeromonas hydrophila]
MRFKALTLIAFAWPTFAIDIGAATTVMAPSDDFLAKTVTNNNMTTKVYEVKVRKTTNPTASGQAMEMPAGELLYSPKRFVLSAGQQQNVKVFYKGVADHQERYYWLTFIESPTAQLATQEDSKATGTQEMKVKLQSILVVRPRQVRFEYQLNPGGTSIINTGNTFFEFMVKRGCEQPESEADSKYLLPGETYQNPRIGQAGNQKLIVYQSRFIRVGKDCWPD